MNKFTIIIFLVLAMLKIQAQDYLISFAGTGDTNMVTTVKADNLTSGATVTLNGGDILRLYGSVGVGALNFDYAKVQIYPNPMETQSMLSFGALETGNTVICIVDLSGKTVYQASILLTTGTHSFHIFGISRGMYFLKVTGKNYFYTAKLISHSNLQGKAGIEFVSSVQHTSLNPPKSADATIDMPYADGDQLLFKGTAGKYSTIIPNIPIGSKTITFNFATCTDTDNNNYSIVQIGGQTWMAENLNVGVVIDTVLSQTNNGIIEKYCSKNDEAKCNVYGGLYQWGEMMQYIFQGGTRGICPLGWHIPTDEDWVPLTNFLGGESLAGGKMKSTGTFESGAGLWYFPNMGATNESGFSAVPAGGRNINGLFGYVGYYGGWWSSTEIYATHAWGRSVSYDLGDIVRYTNYMYVGFSVRCVKD